MNLRLAAPLAAALALAACAAVGPLPTGTAPTPPASAEGDADAPAAPGSKRREDVGPGPARALREARARRLAASGDLARSLTEWKILRLLDPEEARYGFEAEQVRRAIAEGVREHLARARAARSEGRLAEAEAEYLAALALDPREPAAAAGLRETEEERLRAEATPRAGRAERSRSAAPDTAAAGYLETGIELLRQGDLEGSVAELEKYARAYPEEKSSRRHLCTAHRRLGEAAANRGDLVEAVRHLEAAKQYGPDDRAVARELRAARKKLAADLYRKGAAAARADLARAVGYWKQCLALDPDHAEAKKQLEKASFLNEKLKKIP